MPYNNKIKLRYVPYDLANRLKYFGYDGHVLAKYQRIADSNVKYELQFLKSPRMCNGLDTAISAPTWQEIFDWFEELGFNSWIEKNTLDDTYIYQIPSANFDKMQGYYKEKNDVRVALLEKLIELCDENSKF